MTATARLDAPIHDEHAAYVDEQTHARKGHWRDYQSGPGLNAGTTITDIEKTVERAACRVSAVERLIARMGPCPQDDIGLCKGDGKHNRVFACGDQTCTFIGCAACMEVHKSAAHSDVNPCFLELE